MKPLSGFYRRWQSVGLGVVLFLVVGLTFSPALRNGFVEYDDDNYVTSNPRVLQGLSWESFKWAFTGFAAGNWHPLTWLSHQLDVQLFGQRAWGHHLTSVLLHSLNAVLVFILFRRLTGALWASFCLALLFGVHPLRVESVAWVAERKDLLSATFFLLTLLAYKRYALEVGHAPAALKGRAVSPLTAAPSCAQRLADLSSPERSDVPMSFIGKLSTLHSQLPPAALYLACLALFALALMSKPMVVTLPFVLLLLDYWPLHRFRVISPRALLLEKLPFLLLAFGAGLLTMAAQQQGGAILENVPLNSRIENALVSYARYIGKSFWPVELSPFYPHPGDWPLLATLGGALLVLGLTAAGYLTRKRFPFVLVGSCWFFGMLLPVIGLVPAGEQAMADRYTYLPSIGLFLLVIWAAYEATSLWKKLQPGWIGLMAVVTPAFILVTRTQVSYWHDTVTLFAHALKVTPGNYIALNNLGTAADRQGQPEQAIRHFQDALRVRPGYAHAHNNLGVVWFKNGRVEEATAEFQAALGIAPGYAEAHNNLGTALERKGQFDEALAHFARACELRPEHADARYNLALLLMRKSRYEDAIRHLGKVTELQPGSADAYNNLGFAWQQLRNYEAAISAYRQAVALRPDSARAWFNLGVASYEKGLIDQAIAAFRTALKIKPDYAEAAKNLESLLELKNRASQGK